MTLPAHAGGGEYQDHADTLDIPQTPAPDPSPLLDRALMAGVSGEAFRMLYAAARTVEHHRWLPLDVLAAAAGLSHHAARPLAAELVRADLLQQARKFARVSGRKRDRVMYLVAVSR